MITLYCGVMLYMIMIIQDVITCYDVSQKPAKHHERFTVHLISTDILA